MPQILDHTQAWTQQAFNNAYRRLQALLYASPTAGFQGLKADTIISGFYATTNTDPASQQSIDVNGSFDGTNPQTTPTLPSTLIEPMEVWERIHVNSGTPNQFLEMDKLDRALPAIYKGNWNRSWQWRQDTLYLPGSLVIMDLRVFYGSFLPDLADNGAVPWYNQAVPISRCLDSLSLFICAEAAMANQDADGAAALDSKAQAAAMLIGARDTEEIRMARSAADVRTKMLEAA